MFELKRICIILLSSIFILTALYTVCYATTDDDKKYIDNIVDKIKEENAKIDEDSVDLIYEPDMNTAIDIIIKDNPNAYMYMKTLDYTKKYLKNIINDENINISLTPGAEGINDSEGTILYYGYMEYTLSKGNYSYNGKIGYKFQGKIIINNNSGDQIREVKTIVSNIKKIDIDRLEIKYDDFYENIGITYSLLIDGQKAVDCGFIIMDNEGIQYSNSFLIEGGIENDRCMNDIVSKIKDENVTVWDTPVDFMYTLSEEDIIEVIFNPEVGGINDISDKMYEKLRKCLKDKIKDESVEIYLNYGSYYDTRNTFCGGYNEYKISRLGYTYTGKIGFCFQCKITVDNLENQYIEAKEKVSNVIGVDIDRLEIQYKEQDESIGLIYTLNIDGNEAMRIQPGYSIVDNKNKQKEYLENENYKYLIEEDGNITIIKYIGNDEKVSVPEQIGSINVTKIGSEAFKDCTNIEEIILSKNIQSIGKYAFYGCNALNTIICLSQNDIKIAGDLTFENCSNLWNLYCYSRTSLYRYYKYSNKIPSVHKIEDYIYTVTFKDYNGTILKEEEVITIIGNIATAPDVPIRVGYIFIGWDKKFVNVKSNLTVTAKYRKIGDADGDGEITSFDAYETLEYSILGEDITNSKLVNLDIDMDGLITAFDAYKMLEYSVGIIDTNFWN